MLFEEWEEGTGLHDFDEYKTAEELYGAMPNSFQKKDLYALRLAMSKEHFLVLCSIVTINNGALTRLTDDLTKMSKKYKFVMRMIETLKEECAVDVFYTYSQHEASKAQERKLEELNKQWEAMNDKLGNDKQG